jgi:hypothetical protein
MVRQINHSSGNDLTLPLIIERGDRAFGNYQGTSNALDSQLIWTREMSTITLHDAFVPAGCDSAHPPQPAVTVETGARWLAVYDAMTTRSGHYVQGAMFRTLLFAHFPVSRSEHIFNRYQ